MPHLNKCDTPPGSFPCQRNRAVLIGREYAAESECVLPSATDAGWGVARVCVETVGERPAALLGQVLL